MSAVSVFHKEHPSSNMVADVITVLDHDSPSEYRVEWEGQKENPAKTYDVKEFRFGQGPKMVLEGNRIIDPNPSGHPQVVYTGSSDGYERRQRLIDMELFSSKFHWRLQVRSISQDLQNKLGLSGTTD
jgi:hypothetical protein